MPHHFSSSSNIATSPGMSDHFPAPLRVNPEGVVASTPNITVPMLLEGYQKGLFPWSENPVRWYCPEQRAVFIPSQVKLPRNLPKLSRKAKFTVTHDQAFKKVMTLCIQQHNAEGCWIGPQFLAAYTALHEQGYAHSIEVWQNEQLVGGLYGVHIGAMFAGESMFHLCSNASKVAFAALVSHLQNIGVMLMDAQVLNSHTARLGAVEIERAQFLGLLEYALHLPCKQMGEQWREITTVLPQHGDDLQPAVR